MVLTTTGGTQRIEKFILQTAVKQRNVALKVCKVDLSYFSGATIVSKFF